MHACPFYVEGSKMCAACSHQNDKTAVVLCCWAEMLQLNLIYLIGTRGDRGAIRNKYKRSGGLKKANINFIGRRFYIK